VPHIPEPLEEGIPPKVPLGATQVEQGATQEQEVEATLVLVPRQAPQELLDRDTLVLGGSLGHQEATQGQGLLQVRAIPGLHQGEDILALLHRVPLQEATQEVLGSRELQEASQALQGGSSLAGLL